MGLYLRFMRIVSLQTLRTYWIKNPETEQALLAWYDSVLFENWKQPADIKERYASATILKKRRVVFNIKGNKFRLIVAVAYKIGVVYIKFIGTHKEYDAVDAETVEMLERVTMNIKPIRTAKDHKAALAEISKLMETDPDIGTPKGDRLDVLVTLVQAYEAQHFPMSLPDPVEAIKFRMEQQGLKPKDLEPMIGKSNRVYEVLTRKRSLTIGMIRKLHSGLGIPAQSLIQEAVHT